MFPDPEARSSQPQQVATLAQSLPFMQALHDQTVVIVYAGASVHTPESRASFSNNVALLALTGMRPVVVHGGMPQFPATIQASGAGALAIPVARTALAEVNLELVRLIDNHGVKALGINGHDGHLITADALAEPDFTSPIKSINVPVLSALQAAGLLPVIMPLASDTEGGDKLLRPERLGSLLAQQMNATTLVMLVERDVLQAFADHRGLLGKAELEKWLAEHANSNAAGYAREALGALTHGVQSVHFVDIAQPQSMVDELLSEEGQGVVFCKRSSAELLTETQRYFSNSDSILRPGFKVERKLVVRF